MKRWEALTVHLSTLLVGGTGLVYAWMRYVLPPADEWSVIHHPLQPATQHLHVLAAPLLVFAVGLIWSEHVWGHFRRGVRSRRVSGIALLASLVPMAASGYLLQTAADETWRGVWVAVHVTTSLLFLAGYVGHALAALRSWLRRRALAAAGDADEPATAAAQSAYDH